MNIKKLIRIILFGGFLIIILPYGSIKKYCRAKEQILGPFKLGGKIEEVRERLGELYTTGPHGVYSKDRWGFKVDDNDKTLKSISYDEIDIKDGYNYPETSKGITVGSKLDEVRQAYGVPEQVLSIKAGFVLKNSELSMTYLYSPKGVWFRFINQNPYSDTDKWRVLAIVVGDKDIMEEMSTGDLGLSLKPITPRRRRHIIRAYKKKYGGPKDLEIYDDYMLNLQIDSFEHIKSSTGEYLVTPFVVLPKKYELLYEIFDEDAPDIEGQAKKKIVLKYGISFEELEEIIKKVGEFQWDRTYREIVEVEDDDF